MADGRFEDFTPENDPILGAGINSIRVSEILEGASSTVKNSFKDFGAKGNGIANDTVAIRTALNSGLEHLKIPMGVYIVDSEILVNNLQNNLNIQAEKGAIIKLVSGANIQNVFKFTNTKKNITIDGLEIDANFKAAICLWVQNPSADMTNVAKVKLSNCTFRNGLQTPATLFSSGLYLRGGFESLDATRCEFINFYSTHSSPVVHGAMVGQENSVDNWTKVVNFTNCLVEDIWNDTESDSDGLAYFTNFSDTTFHQGQFKVSGCTFRNCKGRSIKSQCQQNTITGNTFYRTKYDGNLEIDIQYSGATISNNIFYSQGYRAHTTVGGSVRDLIHSACSISKNDFMFDGVTGENVIAFDTTGMFPMRGITIDGNNVRGVVNKFTEFRVSQVVGNFVSIFNNKVDQTLVGFVRAYMWGDGEPVLRVAMMGNEHKIGNGVMAVDAYCKIFIESGLSNCNIAAGENGGLAPLQRMGTYMKRIYSDMSYTGWEYVQEIPWNSLRSTMKITCAISYANVNESTYYLSTFEAWILMTINGIFFINKVENFMPELGSWSVEQNADRTGIIIKRSIGSVGTWSNFSVVCEGTETIT